MNRHTADELAVWQKLPLEIKERMSMTRIHGWFDEYGVDGVYVATSGGKDSTVLSHLVHRTLLQYGYEDTVPRVFANTGLEYPSVRLFALSQPNAVQIRPKKTFKEVLLNYGYPIISKEVSECIDSSRKYIDEWERRRNNLTDRQTDRQTDEIVCAYAMADILGIERRSKADREAYTKLKKGIIPDKDYKFKLPIRLLQMVGKVPHVENGEVTNEYSKMYDKSRWAWLLDAPFRISNQCCYVMKKGPMHDYQKKTGKNPYVGTMAEESRLRKSNWLKNGCNSFNGKNPSSKPLSFWTEQDILQYIKKYNLEIAGAYGEVRVETKNEIEGQMTIQEVLSDYRECRLETTKAKRTGCIFCMFGICQDKERFKRLAQEEPTLCDYVMRGGEFVGNNWQPNDKGLGYWFVIEWLNVNGNLGIYIPDREKYLNKYMTEETQKFLRGGGQRVTNYEGKLGVLSRISKGEEDEDTKV